MTSGSLRGGASSDLFAILVAFVCTACGNRAQYPTALDELDTRQVRQSVVRLRGLVERTPAPIEVLDDDQFVRLLDDRSRTDVSQRGRPRSGLGGATQLVAEQVRAVELADTIGFYDRARKAIFLRRQSEVRGAVPLPWVLAHELTHSLQAQHFPLIERQSLATADEQLAYQALIEGDAMVTMLAYGAEQNFIPLDRALVGAVRAVRRGEAQKFERMGNELDELEDAPPLVREQLVFPYNAGTAFVGQMYRVGGFRLVNRLYELPPRTTEQVLHPEKYLAGEGAVPLAYPIAPAGYRARAGGRMGELGVRGLLQYCTDPGPAVAGAAGWGGDAFTVAEHPNGAEIVLWTTAWDTEADAIEFLEALLRCYDAGTHSYVARQGARVSVIAGFPITNAAEIHGYLLGLPVAPAPREPPFGDARLRPIPELPHVPPPHLADGRYVHPRLDLVMPLPQGFRTTLEDGWLSAERPEGPAALLSVGLSRSVVSTESLAKLYRDFIGEVRPHLKGLRLSVLSNGRIRTPLGPGLERTWGIARTTVRIQVVAIPICNGNGAIVYSRFWSDDYSGRVLHWALDASRRMTAGPPAVCAELTP